ncbi:hypothetical protein DICPUDRAFT_157425 [Dictyostelium purpureum]|uniref:Palmitoyl-protein thioesterase 1 n=1 Tax=Dictyostelium purpureum TaxID=5786 RepID=F0ZZ37_DICPU|nr:uncharacterized protein DICPUDRAFT_157425 [Dictyostelium purpureum]EGC30795.1 hypothetical protein DICPUDRAFT_157425 [Dictyostelium purpureum]|eukprot:XP_003292685.1 hypothetical protein DICPUDRAFT_157425 [Dictyostelium purpureum]
MLNKKLTLSIILFIFSFINYSLSASSSDATPIRNIVIWHGLGDSCCFPFSMGKIKDIIQNQYPGVYVKSIEIGSSIDEDVYNSWFKNVNEQIDMACEMIKADTNLTNGFNAVGFSQGSLFLRAFVERCNDPPVHNLISIGGPQNGVFGAPRCATTNGTFCNVARNLLELGAYDEYVQNNLVPAEYWQDPLQYSKFLEKSIFLADINNMKDVKNQTYKDNLLSLNKFALTLFLNDTIVIPRESEHFGWYEEGQAKNIIPMEKTQLYQEDWIGIQQLDNEGKLIFLESPGNHLQFTEQWFIENIIPLLNE